MNSNLNEYIKKLGKVAGKRDNYELISNEEEYTKVKLLGEGAFG